MCNVCLAYLSVPLVSFSINKGGDYIDDATASVTGTINTRVRGIKENGFDLQKKPPVISKMRCIYTTMT
jgi:hypothetical protein